MGVSQLFAGALQVHSITFGDLSGELVDPLLTISLSLSLLLNSLEAYNIHVQQEDGPPRQDTASTCWATTWYSFGYLVVTNNTQTHKL